MILNVSNLLFFPKPIQNIKKFFNYKDFSYNFDPVAMIYFSCRVQEGHITVAERQGWGLKLNWADITEKSFKAAIVDLVNKNPE